MLGTAGRCGRIAAAPIRAPLVQLQGFARSKICSRPFPLSRPRSRMIPERCGEWTIVGAGRAFRSRDQRQFIPFGFRRNRRLGRFALGPLRSLKNCEVAQ